jgi:hypothetical protein
MGCNVVIGSVVAVTTVVVDSEISYVPSLEFDETFSLPKFRAPTNTAPSLIQQQHRFLVLFCW